MRPPAPNDADTLTDSLPGAPTRPEAPPVLADRYRPERKIGAGGFGQVWEAEDRVLGDKVAIKLVSAFGPDAVFRARQELTALRRARLPGVVNLRDDGVASGYFFLVMDRVEGVPFPGAPPPLPWSALRPLALRLLQNLAAVHFAGLVHLDLKPGNVLVREDGQPILLDFGLARGRALAGGWGDNSGATLEYAPPEQLRGEPMGEASDLYALGAMLYWALSGQLPHAEAGDAREMLSLRQTSPARPLRAIAPSVPEPVAAVIDALLSRLPADRPADALSALAALGGAPPPPFHTEPLNTERPSSEIELQRLFHGPDAFLHLREDAAKELWRRTGGWPRWVREELAGWLSAGLGHWRDDAVAMERAQLDRLIGGLVVAPGPADDPGGDAGLALRWIRRVGPDASPPLLGQLTGLDAAALDAAIAQLVAQRRAWILPNGDLAARAALEAPEARREAARRLAALLPPQHPGRLRQLVDAGVDAETVLAELIERLDALTQQGQAKEGFALADFGLMLARQHALAGPEEALLTRMSALVLSEESGELLDRVLYELGRTAPSFALSKLELLLRAARALRQGEPARARAELAEVPPLDYEPLEIRRVAFGVRAAWADGVDGGVLTALERWATTPERRGWLLTWSGNRHYASLEFREAARLHAQAAALRQGYGRAASLLNAALALLEVPAPEAADLAAAEVVAWSRAHRWPALEAQAIWLRRRVACSTGAATAPRPDLAEAAARISPFVEALMALNEAAVAWRCGRQEQALHLAKTAERAARAGRLPLPGLLAGALIVALGEDGERAALQQRARRCPVPGVALQALALLDEPDWPEPIVRFARGLPEAERALRRELLSVEEAERRVGRR